MDTIEWIEWRDSERAFVTNLGQTFKKYEHIPKEYRRLILVRKNTKNNKSDAIKHDEEHNV